MFTVTSLNIFLLLLAIDRSFQDEVLTAESGIVEVMGNSNTEIRLPESMRIVFEIQDLSLPEDAALELTDGRTKILRIYGRSENGELVRETGNGLWTAIALPFKISTMTWKLFIGTSGDASLAGEYAGFSDKDACDKSLLEEEVKCDTHRLNPMAKYCTALHCPEFFEARPFECVAGLWTGEGECIPTESVISTCKLDVNTESIVGCPYSLEQYVRYEHKKESSRVIRSSGGTKHSCKPFCGTMARRDRRCRKRRFYACIMCKVAEKCRVDYITY